MRRFDWHDLIDYGLYAGAADEARRQAIEWLIRSLNLDA
jgi:hypothetical protein